MGRTPVIRALVALLVALGALLPGAPAAGAPPVPKDRGHPTVVLDALTLPAIEDAPRYERHLRQVLRREARRADWGVGRGRRIEYRFTLERLEAHVEGGVLRVRCEAFGRLPRGKSARSKLSYGGDPRQRRQVFEKVLEIVARGVITRLAELERARRGEPRKVPAALPDPG
jgi:hypothetical protein